MWGWPGVWCYRSKTHSPKRRKMFYHPLSQKCSVFSSFQAFKNASDEEWTHLWPKQVLGSKILKCFWSTVGTSAGFSTQFDHSFSSSQFFFFFYISAFAVLTSVSEREFIEGRRRALGRFINLVARHPLFSQDEVVKTFLTFSGSVSSVLWNWPPSDEAPLRCWTSRKKNTFPFPRDPVAPFSFPK